MKEVQFIANAEVESGACLHTHVGCEDQKFLEGISLTG